jgi:glutamine synthetase
MPLDEGFIGKHGLYTAEQEAAAEALSARVERDGLRTIRVIWVDQHGAPRAKFVSPQTFASTLREGLDFSGAPVSLDTANSVFALAFSEGGGVDVDEMSGFTDMVLVPDPRSFRVLPWADRTGWVVCDAHFANGKRHPLDSRGILRRQLSAAAELGYDYVAGLELEFFLFRRSSDPIDPRDIGFPTAAPRVGPVNPGYQFLSEVRLAALSDLLTPLRDALYGVGLPPSAFEHEWGPGQIEVTFSPLRGLEAADAAVLFRSTVKQVAEDHGLLATFMSWPALPNLPSSGWHLHQSLTSGEGGPNAFSGERERLSPLGRQFAAGILAHARPMTVFSTPTVTGFKRFRPYSFAPDNVNWAVDNRGAMLRVQGAPGSSATRLENRLGEPSANPYLYLASNVAAGLDGIRRGLEPPPLAGPDPYAAGGERLPRTLGEAVDLLDRDSFFRDAFGPTAVDYMVRMKRAEWDRFLGTVTDWEMREYLEFF